MHSYSRTRDPLSSVYFLEPLAYIMHSNETEESAEQSVLCPQLRVGG